MEKQSNLTIKGVIFDFDETLFDLTVDWTIVKKTLEKKFKQYGVDIILSPFADQLQIALLQIRKEFGLHKANQVKEECYHFLKQTEIQRSIHGKFLPHAKRLLSFLETNHIAICVVTSNSHEVVENIFTRHKLSVPYIVGREDVRKFKPDPEGVLDCLQKLQLNKKTVIGIGNSIYDIKAFEQAGLSQSFLLTNKHISSNPYIIEIQSLKEIITWIKDH